ncbi:uncharacterized protein [Clytia hemisphaerica]|uniref:uncharacterized protein n=1 Tax=Clytia hemisphaerica TaxID=252671 RepID=UPI0034D5413E
MENTKITMKSKIEITVKEEEIEEEEEQKPQTDAIITSTYQMAISYTNTFPYVPPTLKRRREYDDPISYSERYVDRIHQKRRESDSLLRDDGEYYGKELRHKFKLEPVDNEFFRTENESSVKRIGKSRIHFPVVPYPKQDHCNCSECTYSYRRDYYHTKTAHPPTTTTPHQRQSINMNSYDDIPTMKDQRRESFGNLSPNATIPSLPLRCDSIRAPNNTNKVIQHLEENDVQTPPFSPASTNISLGSPSTGSPGKYSLTGDDREDLDGESTLSEESSILGLSLQDQKQGKGKYICKICDRDFTWFGNFQKHVLQHGNIKENDYFFPVDNLAEEHMISKESNNNFRCKLCNKTFTRVSSLKTHIRMHNGLRPFKCKECELAFTTNRALKMHSRIHSGERPYKCGLCDKTFTRKDELQAHTYLHKGEKPYKCEVCSSAFVRQGHLQRHMLTHASEKPYKCKLCPKSFTQYRNLQTHIYKHTGERPYKCQYCGKGFTQHGTVQAHERTHTGMKPYACDHCDKRFITSSHLRWHVKKHHANPTVSDTGENSPLSVC